MVYLVLCATGEVASWSPVQSTVAGHAVRFCDPALGFAISWIYWLKYVVVVPKQLTAAASLISFWAETQRVNAGVWITAFLIIIITANYYTSPFFGTYEVVLSSFKILVVLGIVILCAVLAVGTRPEALHWKDSHHEDAEWPEYLYVFCDTLPSAILAYLGSEMIGMTIVQTQDPRRTTARAIRLTSYRIVVLNIVSITVVVILALNGLVKSNENGNLPMSAFLVAIQMAGIPVLPHIVNACILLFALSSATSGLHVATGTLYRMSLDKKAPACFSFTDRRGIPISGLCLSSCMATLAYLNVFTDSKFLFRYFMNLVTMLSILTWISILATHLSFDQARKAQRIPDEVLVFKAPLGQLGSWVALVSCVMITLFRTFGVFDHHGVDYTAFATSYLGLPLYFSLIIGYKATTRCRKVDPTEAGLFNHAVPIEAPKSGSLGVGVEKSFDRHKQRVKQFVKLWVL